MIELSANEFIQNVKADPSWAASITEKTVVKGYCDLDNSEIRHLSPYLNFQGNPSTGWCASFKNCRNLKVATGNFTGTVDFDYSAIEKIEHFVGKVNEQNDRGDVHFLCCTNLKVAEGTFHGYVSFDQSGVETIGDLKLLSDNKNFGHVSFYECRKLSLSDEWLNSSKIEIDDFTLQRIIKERAAKRLIKEQPEIEI